MANNADALFGLGVGGATSSPSTPSMRVAYGADGTAVYKSVPPGSSPPRPAYHHQPPSSTTGESPAAPHGLNMNVVLGSSDHYHHLNQQQPMMGMMKKKRGRPRKYEGVTDGTVPLALMPAAAAAARPTASAPPPPPVVESTGGGGGGAFSPSSGGGGGGGGERSGGGGSPTSFKKRGRPPGSTNKKKHDPHHQPIHVHPLGSAGFGFTPHVISVQAGEDVSAKIMTFSQNGPRAICILSANGSVSNVTLRQAATSGGTATYEGRFEILSLCGSYLLTEVAGQRSRTGGLSVSLAGSDGRVLGGCVAGLLIAASPVQVIVGSFIPDGRKETKPQNHSEPTTTTQYSSPPIPMPMPMSMSMPSMLVSGSGGGGVYGASAGGGVSSGSPSQGGSFSESSGGEGGSPAPNHHSTGGPPSNNHNHNNNSNSHAMLGMPWR